MRCLGVVSPVWQLRPQFSVLKGRLNASDLVSQFPIQGVGVDGVGGSFPFLFVFIWPFLCHVYSFLVLFFGFFLPYCFS